MYKISKMQHCKLNLVNLPNARYHRAMKATLIRVFLLVALGLGARTSAGQSPALRANEVLAREIFTELIGINTTYERGATTPAAEAIARRLRAAGFLEEDVQVIGATEKNKSLVARFRGTGKRRPILLLAHLDVVEALRSDWSLEPFKLTEKDGYFYGRGTSDIKDMAAIWTATLIRLKQERFVPDRDIILALTAGEEGGVGDDNGVRWLIAKHRNLIDAAYTINGDSGDPLERNGKKFARAVQASEKVFHNVQLEARNPGGHSSQPRPDNAIYQLASALSRLAAFNFPASLNQVTRAYLVAIAPTQSAAVEADIRGILASPMDTAAVTRFAATSPLYNALLRTTCVATRLEGGHANNALPQTARALVNCRILPQDKAAEVEATIRRVVADSGVTVTPLDSVTLSPPSPIVPEVFDPIARITKAMWGDVRVIPNMETGATDGLYLRNIGMPVYGVSGVFLEADDMRAHGKDERIGVRAFYEGVEFSYRLVKALAGGRP
jgi:acetylornithine deacetylase/succinyl-diaminopimelate desuccinylase-like protein